MGKTDSQIKGEVCEEWLYKFLEQKCPINISINEGADRICITQDGSIEFWEAKYGKGRLTKKQIDLKETATNLGIPYYVFRCKVKS